MFRRDSTRWCRASSASPAVARGHDYTASEDGAQVLPGQREGGPCLAKHDAGRIPSTRDGGISSALHRVTPASMRECSEEQASCGGAPSRRCSTSESVVSPHRCRCARPVTSLGLVPLQDAALPPIDHRSPGGPIPRPVSREPLQATTPRPAASVRGRDVSTPKHRDPLGVFAVKERFDQPAGASILSVTPVSRVSCSVVHAPCQLCPDGPTPFFSENIE